MNKISNEVKVGAVAILTFVVFIWLYSFLKGKDFFKNTINYYSVYDEVGGLAESSPVEINGFKVGVVQSVELLNKESGKLLVVFSVSKDFKLPRNTIAEITTVSFIAGMKVQFVFGNGPGTYSEGDTIPGRLAESLMTRFETELIPLKDKISKLVDALDTVINSVNEIMNTESKKNLNGSLANLNNISENMDDILGSKGKELKTTLENISRFSQMLSDNSGKMSRTVSNLETITDTLAAADIYSTVLHLKTTLEKTSQLLENMNGGKGSAGQFLTNDTLYANFSRSLVSLNALLDDMKANPKRYVHFSIFGKKSESSR